MAQSVKGRIWWPVSYERRNNVEICGATALKTGLGGTQASTKYIEEQLMKTKGLERMSKLMYIVSCFLQNNQYYITVSCCSSALALSGGREKVDWSVLREAVWSVVGR